MHTEFPAWAPAPYPQRCTPHWHRSKIKPSSFWEGGGGYWPQTKFLRRQDSVPLGISSMQKHDDLGSTWGNSGNIEDFLTVLPYIFVPIFFAEGFWSAGGVAPYRVFAVQQRPWFYFLDARTPAAMANSSARENLHGSVASLGVRAVVAFEVLARQRCTFPVRVSLLGARRYGRSRGSRPPRRTRSRAFVGRFAADSGPAMRAVVGRFLPTKPRATTTAAHTHPRKGRRAGVGPRRGRIVLPAVYGWRNFAQGAETSVPTIALGSCTAFSSRRAW